MVANANAENTNKSASTGAAKAAAAVAVVEQAAPSAYPTDEQMRKDGFDTLSARIRHLKSLGMSTGDIARTVKRENGEHPKYQHVRNVLLQPLKKQSATASTDANEGGDTPQA